MAKLSPRIGIAGVVIAMLALLVASLFLHIFLLPDGLYQHDAVQTANAVERWLTEGVLTGQTFGRYGSVLLAMLALTPAKLLLASGVAVDYRLSELAVIIADQIAACLIILPFFLLLRVFSCGAVPSLIAALTLSVSPALLTCSTIGKEHAAEALFLFLCWLLTLLARQSPTRHLLLYVGSAFVAALALSIRESVLLYVPFTVGGIFISEFSPSLSGVREPASDHQRRIIDAAKLSGLWLISFLVFAGALLGWYLFAHLENTLLTPDPTGNVQRTLPQLSVALRLSSDFITALTLMGVYLAFVGALSVRKFCRLAEHRALVVMSLSLLGAFVLTPYRFRYFLPTFCFLYIFVAFGLQMIYQRSRLFMACVVFFLIVMELTSSIPIVYARSRLGNFSVKSWAKDLVNYVQPNSVIITCDYHGFVSYYTSITTKIYCAVPTQQSIAELISKIDSSLGQGEAVYLTESAFSYDRTGQVMRTLGSVYEVNVASTNRHESAYTDGLHRSIVDDRIWRVVPRQSSASTDPSTLK